MNPAWLLLPLLIVGLPLAVIVLQLLLLVPLLIQARRSGAKVPKR